MFKINDRFHAVQVDGKMIGLDIISGEYFEMNSVAMYILQVINTEEDMNLQKIVGKVIKEFDVEYYIAYQDVEEFIAKLTDEGWIVKDEIYSQ